MPSSPRNGMVDCNVSGALVRLRRSRIEHPWGLKIYFRFYLNQRTVGGPQSLKQNPDTLPLSPFYHLGAAA